MNGLEPDFGFGTFGLCGASSSVFGGLMYLEHVKHVVTIDRGYLGGASWTEFGFAGFGFNAGGPFTLFLRTVSNNEEISGNAF